MKLLLASNDSLCYFSPFETDVDKTISLLRLHPQDYWARRLFNFLKKLPELKTASKDEKLLLNFDIHVQSHRPLHAAR